MTSFYGVSFCLSKNAQEDTVVEVQASFGEETTDNYSFKTCEFSWTTTTTTFESSNFEASCC